MAAVVNNSAKVGAADNVATLETGAFAVGGVNRVLYALVGSGAGTPTDPTAVKWEGSGGTSMTQIGTTINCGANVKMSLWRLIAPNAASSTVHATWAGNQDERWIIPVAVEDADQATPNGTVAQGTGTNLSATVNADSVAGDLVLDFLSYLDSAGGGRTCTKDASQTEIQNLGGVQITAFEGAGSSSETAAGASTTMSWAISGGGSIDGWGTFAFAVNGATGGGGDTTSNVRVS